MSASVGEVQELADQILAVREVTLPDGQLILHYSDDRVQRCEIRRFYKPEELDQMIGEQVLELLGTRMRSGQLVIPYRDGTVQRCETNTIHRPQQRRVTDLLDKPPATGAL